jgi:hypothetical protein
VCKSYCRCKDTGVFSVGDMSESKMDNVVNL